MIAFVHRAAAPASLLEMLAAAAPVAPAAKPGTASPFHSMLLAVSEANDHPNATSESEPADKEPATYNAPAAAVPVSAQRAVTSQFTSNIVRPARISDENEEKSLAATPSSQSVPAVIIPALPLQRTTPPALAFNIFRPSHTPDRSGEENSAAPTTSQPIVAAMVPAPPQPKTAQPPITLNIFRTNKTPDQNYEESSEAAATSGAIPIAAVPLLPQQWTAAPPITLSKLQVADTRQNTAEGNSKTTLRPGADTVVRPKIKPSATASMADTPPAVVATVLPMQTAALPIALNIFAPGDTRGENEGETTETLGAADKSEASARPRAAISVASRIQPTEQMSADRVAPKSTLESQPDPDQPLKVDATASDASLSKLEPAFEMRLQPASPRESRAPTTPAPTTPAPTTTAPTTTAPTTPAPISSEPKASPPLKDDMPQPAAAAQTMPSVAPAAFSSPRQGDGSRHPAQERPQEAATATVRDASAQVDQTNFDLNATTPTPGPGASGTPPASHAEALTEPALPAPQPEPAAVAPAAHDIKLELNGGGQRVEVHLTERGGDVHVAVRTADERLSGAMREDLPALAAKLEQSGLRADAGQSGAAGSNERRPLETGPGNASQDSQEHSGRNQQQKQDDPQQQPKNPATTANRKSDRKDFAWLLQTYR